MSGLDRDDIIRIAQEISGVAYPSGMDGVKIGMSQDHLERFAALIAAAEREACAKLCDQEVGELAYGNDDWYIAKTLAAIIRARGEA